MLLKRFDSKPSYKHVCEWHHVLISSLYCKFLKRVLNWSTKAGKQTLHMNWYDCGFYIYIYMNIWH